MWPNTTSKNVAHGVTGIDKIIHLYGYCYATSTGISNLVLNSVRPNGVAGSIGLYGSDTNITVEAGSDRTNLRAYATMMYTKT